MAGKRKWQKRTALLAFLIFIVSTASAVNIWWDRQKEQLVEELSAPEQDYSAAERIEEARQKLEENPQIPTVITDINTLDKKVALCFEGSVDRMVLEQILEYLNAHDMTATFFISALDAAEDQEAIDEILLAGHDMQSYTLYGTPHMEEMSQEELLTDFCRAQVVYEDKIDSTPEFLKCNATEYTDEVMESADACGYSSIIFPTQYLNYQSFSKEETAKNYVAGLGRGRVISVKLSGYLDELEYEETKVDEDPAKDKKPGIELHELEEEELTETERLLNVVQWLLGALDEAEYETVRLKEFPSQDIGDLVLKYEEIEENYEEVLAEAVSAVHTTDREVAFTFRGIGDKQRLDNVLAVLNERGITGTFFVTGTEVEEHPDNLEAIIAAGHEIGNGGYSGKSLQELSFAEICEDIEKNNMILERYGVRTDLFMPPYGAVSEDIQRAAAATEMKLITYNSAPVRTDYLEKETTPERYVNQYYGQGRIVLCRGDIVFFNLNALEDATLAAGILDAVYSQKVLPTRYGSRTDNMLQVTTISGLMDNTWGYPAYTKTTYNKIQKSGNAQRSWEESLSTHYIGVSWQEFPGFTEGEVALMDTVGRINTGGTNTVFLTFDDWGNEDTIGRLLYVLKKHNVKASFFIKTDYVMDGSTENLLRAIAEDGHDVSSHTHRHIPIDIDETGVEALQNDLVSSNRTLASIVGDTGTLKNYFRPPTLAVSKIGVNTVYDCGYDWIVCGDVSTGDYHATSVDDMYDLLRYGARNDDGSRLPIQDGTIVVMHINTSSIYTAQGLDRYLNWQEELPEGDPNKFHFAKLSDYLQ